MVKSNVWIWGCQKFKAITGEIAKGIKHAAQGSATTWKLHIILSLSATTQGNASTMSKESNGEGEKKKRWRKGAGEMLMSCPVQYPYLWSRYCTRPPCHALMQEYIKQWEVPHVDQSQPCPLFFFLFFFSYPHTVPHTHKHTHFMFG